MHSHRSTNRPLFETSRWLGPTWGWTVQLSVTSAGYVNLVSVCASRHHESETLMGTASCDICHTDDWLRVIGSLATEAMLAAISPQLDGTTALRHFRGPHEIEV